MTVRSYDYFRQAITDYCKENGKPVPAFIPVKLLRNYERNNHFGTAVTQVYDIIRNETSPQDTKILIDTAGGMRNISIMMQSMTRLLQYYGYQTAAYYTNFGEKRIFCDHTDRQLAIMEALAEFAQHGTVRKLRVCFRDNRIPEISELLDAMQTFADSIQLCRTQELPAIINERIFPLLNRIDSLKGKDVSQEDVAALRQMADYIRFQFGFNPWEPEHTVTAVDLIRWCLNNDLVQQAVTLFTENIPKYLVQIGVLRVAHPEEHLPSGFNTQEGTWLYSDVIEGCYQQKRREINKLLFDLDKYLNKDNSRPPAGIIREIVAAVNGLSGISGIDTLSAALVKNDVQPRNKTEQMLRDYIIQNNFRTYGFFKSHLKNDKAFQQKLLGFEEAVYDETDRETSELKRKIIGIKVVSSKRLHTAKSDYQLILNNESTEEFRAFLMYYLYLKKRVRNSLSHASEGGELSEEFVPAFQAYGIITDDLTIDNIKKNIEAALKYLNACVQ